jgi:hypothetical protein
MARKTHNQVEQVEPQVEQVEPQVEQVEPQVEQVEPQVDTRRPIAAAIDGIVSADRANKSVYGKVADLCRQIIRGFATDHAVTLDELTSAKASSAGQTLIGKPDKSGNQKTAFDDLRSRLTKVAKDQGFILKIVWSKKDQRFTSATLTALDAVQTLTAPAEDTSAYPMAVDGSPADSAGLALDASRRPALVDLASRVLESCHHWQYGAQDLIDAIRQASGLSAA